MAKDPAFLFYPGDYLRDTQCLSEAVQVAYDRIMCEHMRNICISQQQLNFFTKKLNEAEKIELDTVLTKTDSGYQITWVADSILKYNAFRQSRSHNRAGKKKDHVNNTSKSSEQHMESENENEIEDENTIENEKLLVPKMASIFKAAIPTYPDDRERDAKALLSIAKFLCQRGNLRGAPEHNAEPILEAWEQIAASIREDRFYCQKSLSTISNHIQEIVQKALHGDKSKSLNPIPGGKLDDDKLKAALAKRTGGG